ncbi:UNVERIFIED_CONTAM: hypothetical protein GTU68_062493, partial [Idotea baltica]|nr:hypothetical protein [Idotea baltica]
MNYPHFVIIAFISLGLFACEPATKSSGETASTTKSPETTSTSEYPTIGSIEQWDVNLWEILPEGAQIEILAEGFDWTEGPVWIAEEEMLLFSDIPPNAIYKWKEGEEKSVFLTPSGYTGKEKRGGEVGSNGLLLDPSGQLVLCQHGDRRMARLNASWDKPAPNFETLADKYDGKRFNSPNDATYHSSGDLYFTDPPYGLEKKTEDPAKEIPFQGVYRLDTEGTVHLLTDELTRPNGIAFSPDEKYLYVAVSDPVGAVWMVYNVEADGNISNGRVMYDATEKVGSENKGLPDGMKVDNKGNIFATGPGGVYVFNADGFPLGLIRTTQATSNCAFGNDGKYLY